jgi:hypothetical protein
MSLCILTLPAHAQQKLAQTGMKFLNVAMDARATALGEAFTAVDGEAASLFYNPAGMAHQKSFANVALGQVKWIADIKHNYGSVSFSPWEGDYGVIGVMVQTVDYGNLNMTVRSDNSQGYLDLGTFKPSGTMIGVAYARALSDMFAVGGDVKWIRQNLGDGTIGVDQSGALTSQSNVSSLFAFDFGITYKTGFKSLEFGVAARNFSKEARFVDEGFQLPLTFRFGLSMNLLDFMDVKKEEHQFLLAIDAEHPRDFPERIKMGGEYRFMDIVSLRAGFISLADEQKFSYGVGLQKALGDVGLGVDYAYTPFGIFGNVHQFSFRFTWM